MSKKAPRPPKTKTFQQRLRVQASERLLELVEQLTEEAFNICANGKGVSISPTDLIHVAAGGKTKVLRARLISELVKEKETELEKIWKDQQDFPVEDKSDAD